MLARSIRRACFRLPTTPRVHNPTCVAPSCACAAHLAPPRGPRPSRARPGQRNGSPKKFSPAQAKPDAFIYLFFYVKICIPARPGPGQHHQPKIKTAACICDKLVTFVLVDAHIKLRTLTFKKKVTNAYTGANWSYRTVYKGPKNTRTMPTKASNWNQNVAHMRPAAASLLLM